MAHNDRAFAMAGNCCCLRPERSADVLFMLKIRNNVNPKFCSSIKRYENCHFWVSDLSS